MPKTSSDVSLARKELERSMSRQGTAGEGNEPKRANEDVDSADTSNIDNSDDHSEIHDDANNSIFDNRGNTPIPLKIGDAFVFMSREDTIIGSRSIAVLNRVPKFKGIRARIPEFYLIETTSRSHIILVPHLRAITMLIHSIMARVILPTNITLAVIIK